MKKIAFEISYDGTDYAGFQRQPKGKTIQGELEQALSTLCNESVAIHGSGRTDAGVHALGQVIHFSTRLQIEMEKWPLAIRKFLPKDIIVKRAFAVDEDFHARYDAIAKTYQYRIDRGTVPNILWQRYSYHYPYTVDVALIRRAIPYLVGTHDFSTFCASGSDKEDKVRTIYDITVEEEGDLLLLQFYGNGFLYKMVRILVATLLQVGAGKLPADSIPDIIESKDRHLARLTAPAHGLILMKVDYPPEKLK